MYLLDTNVISALRTQRLANIPAWTWARSTDLEAQFLSVVTILELERGTLQLERRDPIQGARLRRWLDQTVLTVFAARLLAVDVEIARRSAQLHVPDPRPDRDALIAATALTHDMTVVTRNERAFQGTGVSIVNPWAQ